METQDELCLPGTNTTFAQLREIDKKQREKADFQGNLQSDEEKSTSSLNTSVEDPDDMLSDSSEERESKKLQIDIQTPGG